MLLLSVFVLAVVAMCVIIVLTRPDDRVDVVRPQPAPPAAEDPPRPAQAVPASAVRPESLEGMLATLLLAGEITSGQYRHAAEELAAQDDAGYPLTVPPDPGPAGP